MLHQSPVSQYISLPPVAETNQPTSTHINDPKAATTEEHSKEVAPAKVNDKDDARLSETKEKSESEENSTKVADKTTAMKDIIIAREGIEKVESKTKGVEYDAKVDNENSLATKSEKKAAAEEHCKGSEVEGDKYPTRNKKRMKRFKELGENRRKLRSSTQINSALIGEKRKPENKLNDEKTSKKRVLTGSIILKGSSDIH